MIVLLALHAAVGIGVFAAGRVLGRRALLVAAAPMGATLAWLAVHLPSILDGRPYREHVAWVPRLGISAAVRLDAFGALMALAVAGIGVAVLAYSALYFPRHDEGLGRLAGLLTLFGGSMVALVAADDLILLFTAWELTSITSYLLIGNEHTKAQARAAALQALLVTSAGGMVLLAGLVLIGQRAGTFSLSTILAHPPGGTAVTVGLLCIAAGAFTKSAQYPFHFWLPGAMAAPTPVSAYLHSATMVKAGVYVIARFAPVFAASAGPWRPLVITVGAATMIFGALRALRQYDLKLLLAHGTVSQLGFMVVLLGAGTPAATLAGVLVLGAHVAFKCALFMVVGVIDHQCGTRDIRLLPPLGRGWGTTKAVAAAAAASMAGVPLLAGFVAKETAFAAFRGAPFGGAGIVLVAIAAGSALTVAYSARFMWGVLLLPRRLRAGTEGVAVPPPDDTEGIERARPPTGAFVLPAALLALLGVLAGVAPGTLDRAAGAASTGLGGAAAHLALWHGPTLELGITAAVFAVGGALFAARRGAARVLRRGEHIPSGTQVYLELLRGLGGLATRTTAIVQNGTLPIYAGVVLFTAALFPGAVLLTRVDWPGWPAFLDTPGQLPVSIVLLGAAVMAAAIRRRFSAVLFLSVAGYSMAATFALQGAPDLALTQAAVETVSTVLFVLVLRKLPDRFERQSSPRTRALRVAVAAAVGVMVFAFALVARQSRTARPVSAEIVDSALPEGKGRNIVNVILVDFRGFDTLGEITVISAAAIGAVALARAGRRRSASAERR